MELWLLSFVLGSLLSLFFSEVPTIFTLIIAVLAAILIWRMAKLRTISALLLGLVWGLIPALPAQNPLIMNQLKLFTSKQTYLVTANVNTLVVPANNDSTENSTSYRVNMQVTHIKGGKLTKSFLVRVRVNQTQFNKKVFQQGNQLSFTARLAPAHGFANPSYFNYQTWLKQHGIVATGYIVEKQPITLLKYQPSIRQTALNWLLQQPLAHLDLLAALALGERGLISGRNWQILNRSGTQHLMAISGLHLALVASLSLVALRLLLFKLFAKGISSNRNLHYFIIAFSLIITLFYAYLAGFAIPTVRAFIMLSLFWFARFSALHLSLSRWLLLSLVLIILLLPSSVLSSGFYLSFSAVMVIFLALWLMQHKYSWQTSFKQKISQFVWLQLLLSLALLPVTAIAFGRVSVVAIIANMIAIPYMSLVVIPLCLLAMLSYFIWPLLGSWLFQFADASIRPLWWLLTQLADGEWASFPVSLQQSNVILWLILLLALRLFRVSWRYWLITALLVIPISLNSMQNRESWRVNVFDVGHGLAVLLEKNQHAILYDTGAQFLSGFNIAESVILPYLQRQGIKQLDLVILSHQDNDHAGGIKVLANNIPIEKLMANFPTQATSLKQQACRAGQNFHWQSLKVQVLWPNKVADNKNADSCVVRISDPNFSILLTGDIGKSQEKQLIKQQTKLAANVLLVPHHGSTSSSSATFIKAVNPELALFSSGFLNQWHMPKAKVLARYQQLGVKTLNTADEGMIRVEFNQDEYHILSYRRHLHPYWFAN